MKDFKTHKTSKVSSRGYKMDFLSSSEDEESVVSGCDLVDSSSDDENTIPRIKKIVPTTVSEITSVLAGVKINSDEKATPPIQQRNNSTKKNARFLDDHSSSDDDSFLESYKPVFKPTPKKIAVLENSDSEDSTNVTANRSKWRRSVLSKEYTMIDTSVLDAPDFRIPSLLFDRMYDHQKEGVAWMVGLHAGGVGGLLAVSIPDQEQKKTHILICVLPECIFHPG